MSEVNRSLIIIRPKQPFLDWAQTLDGDKSFTLEQLSEDSTAYLIREIYDYADEEELLESSYDILFEKQLAAWWTNEAAWPEARSLKMFLEWFEVEFHSLLFDLVEGPIRVIEDEDEG
jgi:hypothetical protein